MKKLWIFGLVSLFSFILIPAEWAASDDSPSSSTGVEQDPNYVDARKAIKAYKYREAIVLLNKADQAFPDNADVLNLIGYSYRKMGNMERGLQYYQRALKIDPEHLGANEYIGELYLEIDNLDKAEEHLKVLDKACIFGCEEYDDLKEAIATYKKRHGL